MAEAKLNTKTVIEETVTLTLTKDEAEVIRALAGNVGGTHPLRKHSDSVYYALQNAGVRDIHTYRISKSVQFTDRVTY